MSCIVGDLNVAETLLWCKVFLHIDAVQKTGAPDNSRRTAAEVRYVRDEMDVPRANCFSYRTGLIMVIMIMLPC